jgi:hypothetical protein
LRIIMPTTPNIVSSSRLPENRCRILCILRFMRRSVHAIDIAPTVTGTQLGYAPVSTTHQSLDQQMDALTAAGVDATRVYTDKLSGTSTREQRPGLAALLDYARQGDAIVVVGIDRLGRNAAEVMTSIRDLGERGIVLRSLREGIDSQTLRAAWWPESLPVWLSLSWKWAGSAAPRRGTLGGHAVSPLVDQRHSATRRWLWLNGCTPAVSRPAPFRPHWESAVPRCIGCWLLIPMTPGSSSGENFDGGMAHRFQDGGEGCTATRRPEDDPEIKLLIRSEGNEVKGCHWP